LDGWIVSALLLTWCLTIVLVNPSGDFPLNDDWVYGLVVRNLVKTGHFEFISPASANLFSQAYWGALFCLPFGFSFEALRLSTLVIAGLGVASLYGVIRAVGGSIAMATLSSLLLIFNPFYLGLANTFMTDVPFTATLITTLYCYAVALKENSKPHLFFTFVFALAALGIRQYGLIFIAALSIGYIVKKQFRWPAILQAFGATGFGVGLQWTYQRWLESSGQAQVSADPVVQSYLQGIQSAFRPERLQLLYIIAIYAGLFTLPALIVYQKNYFVKFIKSKSSQQETIFTGFAAFTITAMAFNRLPWLGNILTTAGLGPLTLKDTYLMGINYPTQGRYNAIIWIALTIFGSISFPCLLLLTFRSINPFLNNINNLFSKASEYEKELFSPDSNTLSQGGSWFPIALLTSISAYTLILIMGSPFDRYLLPLYPLILILASLPYPNQANLNLIGSPGKVIILLMICFYAYFGIASTHDYLSWNRARWQALNNLTNVQKILPKQIDGGYEFNGWYLADRNYKQKDQKSYWWVDDDEYIVASGPLSGYQEIARYPFKRWLPVAEKPILTLKRATSS